ncbi:MAG: efflux RND transporter periplasmic adaptor subunit [Deltaproteobacteria bacterium]|nr:MAG: efflux RND transporter periplasmic adaptor subunit [Deltaproteobacteria bacterium]
MTEREESMNAIANRNEDTPVARTADEAARLQKSLGITNGIRWGRWLFWLVLLGAVGAGAWYFYNQANAPEPPPTWKTQAVERGNLTTTVTATGSLSPVRTVDIGAEVSGKITQVLVKENDRVEIGQKLVEIDTALLDAKHEQAMAQLEVAKASVRQVRATLAQARAEEKRQKDLAARGVSSAQALESAKADLARASAQLASAQAQERQAQANLTSVETDLSKTVITSPINGIVLSKQVEPGSTVQSSFQAPTLMTIAEDLTKMELHLDVDEADVGLVAAGQKATFTVDAYPDTTFDATVETVWFASTTTSNVVTYRAVLSVDNPELLLRPGMTTTATITTGVAEDVLMVPNAALRYTPPRDALGMGPRGGGGFRMPGMRGGPRPGGGGGGEGFRNGPKVWVLRDGSPRPARVEVGKSDGSKTAVTSERLKEGDLIILGQEKASADGAEAKEKE